MYLVSLCKLEEHTLEVVDTLADIPPEIQAGTLADIQAGVAGTLAADIQSGVVGTLGLVGRLMGLVLEEYFGLWLRTRVPGLYIPCRSILLPVWQRPNILVYFTQQPWQKLCYCVADEDSIGHGLKKVVWLMSV